MSVPQMRVNECRQYNVNGPADAIAGPLGIAKVLARRAAGWANQRRQSPTRRPESTPPAEMSA